MGVVVVGAGGRLGRLLRPRWPQKAAWLSRADVDVSDTDALAQVLSGAQTVLCLAGVTPGSAADMSANVTLARATLDAAARTGAGRVFLFSTAGVYGALGGVLSETGPTDPKSDYARAKLEMEAMAMSHAHPNTVLRLGNVAGADAILGGWTPQFCLEQLPDGTTPKRSYIGPGTLARVLHDLTRIDDLPRLLNLAAPGSVEMGALLDAAGLEWQGRAATGKTTPDVTLDSDTLTRFINFEPKDSTVEGLVADWNQKADV